MGRMLLLQMFFGFSALAQSIQPYQYAPIGTPITEDESFQYFDVGDDYQLTFDGNVLYLEFLQNAYYPESNLWTRYDSIDRLLEIMNRGFKPQVYETGDYQYKFESFRSFKSLQSGQVIFDFLGLIREYSRWSQEASDPNSQEPLKIKFVSADLVTMVGPITSVFVQAHGQFGSRNPWSNIEYLTFNVDTKKKANLLDIVDHQSLLNALKSDYYLLIQANNAKLTEAFRSANSLNEIDAILGRIFVEVDQPINWNYESTDPLNQFTKFALFDYDDKSELLTVWIGLEYASELDSLKFRNLTLKVKPNAEFLKVLKRVKQSPGNTLLRKDANVRVRHQ